jgi:hypothetical protein
MRSKQNRNTHNGEGLSPARSTTIARPYSVESFHLSTVSAMRTLPIKTILPNAHDASRLMHHYSFFIDFADYLPPIREITHLSQKPP